MGCQNCSCRKGFFHRNFLWIFLFFLTLAGIFSCKKDNQKKEYDREKLVNDVYSHCILPSYQNFSAIVQSLKNAADSLNAQPNSQNLINTRQAFISSWLTWQRCSPFEFGPAETISLRSALNTYPTDTTKIHDNILTGIWDFNQAAQLAAKGFPALDFLLFGLDSNQILSRIQTEQNMRLYIQDLANEINTKTQFVLNEWVNTYAATFLQSKGTDVGSSTGMLVNQYNFEIDLMKNGQVGIPLGKKSLGTPLPQKCEGYYCGISIELLLAHVQALQRVFLSQNLSGAQGYGFFDILNELETKVADGRLAADAIQQKFEELKTSVSNIPPPLSIAVVSNPTQVNQTYDIIQQLLIWSKSDMPSAMGILITYQDADGD